MVGSEPDHRADSEPAKCPESLRPMAGVTPHGGDVASVSSENITPPSSLLRTHSPVAAASPLLRFYPRWRSLGRLSPVPAARRTFPTLSLRIFPRMPDPVPRRSHSVPLPVSSAGSSAFPHRDQGRLP